jgi:exopolysaccharide biosynthesis polyprenyl glycosylphosphotransferase
MHSSVGLSRSARESSSKALAVDLQLIKTCQQRNTASRFAAAIMAWEVVADLLTITCAIMLGYVAYGHLSLGKHLHYSAHSVFGLAFGFAVVMVLMLDRIGAYRHGNSLLRVRETEQLLRVSAQAFLLSLAVSFLGSVLFSRWLLVLCLVMVPLALFLEKTLTYLMIHHFHSRGYGTEKVLIYGSGCTGRRVFSVLTRSPKLGLEAVAFVDDDPTKVGSVIFDMGYERRRSASVVEGPINRELIARYRIDRVIIAIPSIGRDTFLRTVEEAFGASARVSFVPSHFLPSDPLVDYQDIDGVLLASFGKSTRRVGYEVFKRVCDFLGSLILVLSGAPVFLLLAFLIKIDSRGPVLFKQERVGRNGSSFGMYKFRTMYARSSPYDYSPRDSGDPRITRIGRFLRRTSLDELPQLLNVLQGEMSLVGPRPEMPFIVEQYTERHKQRLHVKPGLTGLWQLSGDRAFLIHENIEYDLYYIQHRNFFMDLAILLHTSIFAMRGI